MVISKKGGFRTGDDELQTKCSCSFVLVREREEEHLIWLIFGLDHLCLVGNRHFTPRVSQHWPFFFTNEEEMCLAPAVARDSLSSCRGIPSLCSRQWISPAEQIPRSARREGKGDTSWLCPSCCLPGPCTAIPAWGKELLMGLLNKVFVGDLSASWGKAQGCRGSQSLQSTIDAGAWQPVSVLPGTSSFSFCSPF